MSLYSEHQFNIWRSYQTAAWPLKRNTTRRPGAPILYILYSQYYDILEARPLNKSQLAYLDFVVNRFFMKLFKTTDMQDVKCVANILTLYCRVCNWIVDGEALSALQLLLT